MPRSTYPAVLFAVVLAAGCGGGPVPVRGVLKLDGQEVANAAVVFVAQAPDGRDAYGSTDQKGAFRLTTFTSDDGALPGSYKVTITSTGEGGGSTPYDDPDKPPPPSAKKASNRPRIPAKYSSPGQTPLTQQVPASGDVVIDIPSK